jgi:PAS domain S-box-containing protein
MENQPTKGKILIIDKEQDANWIKTALINHNFQVLVANSGEDGIHTATLEKPDLILLEIQIPVLDGFDTCRQLKSDSDVKETPIIFMSAQNEVLNKVAAFNLGAVDYITKPLYRDELIARVNTQVSLFSMQKQLKNANANLENKVNERTLELKNINEELIAAEEELRASNDAYRAINEKLSKQHSNLQAAEAELKKRHEELQITEEELQASNEELIDTIENLHEKEQKLIEAQKLAKLGHYSLNFATGYWTSSQELDRIFGIDNTFERSVEGWVQLIHADFKQEMIEYFTHHVMQLHYKFNKEYKIINPKTMEEKWVHGLGELIFDGKGSLTTMLGTIQDITDRKQVEILKNIAMEALEHERYLMDALMQNIPDTIYFKNADSKFTRINKAQAKLLEIEKPEDAIGKTDFDFFTESHAKEAYVDEQVIVKTGKPIVDKIEMIERSDGKIRWVSTTKVPIKNNKGLVTSIVGVSRDVTEHKEIELKLIENNHALQAAEEELTATNDELKTLIIKLGESETRFKALHNASFGGIAIPARGSSIETIG